MLFRHIIGLWLVVAAVAAAAAIGVVLADNARSSQNNALHSIICFVEYRERTTLPPKQKQQALDFWARALSDAHLPSCGN